MNLRKQILKKLKIEMERFIMTKTNNSMKRCKVCKKAVKNCQCSLEVAVVETVSFVENQAADFLFEEMIQMEVKNELAITDILVEQMQEAPETAESTELSLEDEYENFLQENQLGYSFVNGTFIVDGPKKTVYVKVDLENGFFYVFSVLNKFLGGDVFNQEAIRLHARNKLTLKSLKAAKSFTNCHTK